MPSVNASDGQPMRSVMGSCIARCVCEVGKCFCCDCLVFGSNLRHFRDSIARRSAATKRTNSFALRRQSSSATIEFENLMFDFDLPEFEDKEMSTHFENPLSKCCEATNSHFKQMSATEDTSRELPIIDSLISRMSQTNAKLDSSDAKDRISLGGASSLGELQWENEIIGVDEFNGGEQNGLELEWDDYEQSVVGVADETDQLIMEIEELTKSSIK